MLKKDKKTKIIYTDSDIKVSRFLLDLPAKFNEEIHNLNQEKEGILSKLKNRTKNVKVPKIEKDLINIGKFIRKRKIKKKEKKEFEPVFSDYDLLKEKEKKDNRVKEIRKEVQDEQKQDEEKSVQNIREKDTNFKKKKKVNKHQHKLERLAFFPLFKILYFLIRKILIFLARIFHGTGWVAVFLFRFVFILLWRISKNIFKGIFKISFFKRNKKRTFKKNVKIKENKKAKNFFAFKKEKSPNINFIFSDHEFIHPKKKEKKREETKKEKQKKFFSFKNFKFKELAFRPALGFLMILIIFALPLKAFTYYKDLNLLKGRVLEASEEAVSNVVEGSHEMQDKDFNEAGSEFKIAEDNFSKAQDEVKNLSLFFGILGNIIPQKEIKLAGEANNILEAGSLSAKIGSDLNNLLSDFDSGNLKTEEIINSLSDKVKKIKDNVFKLNLIIENINPKIVPEEYYNTFKNIQGKFKILSGNINEFSDLLETLKIFSGFYNDQRYLLVFQNNTEMRGSGGFIGSYALADLRNGEIINLEVPKGGSYDTEGGLYEKIISPEPLHLVDPLWHFWDANWWPDWSMSAEKLMWFYEKSGGPTVDGVISFTPTVLEKILKIVGPLDMTNKYGKIIDADNFWEITQKIVEEKPLLLESKTDPSSEQIKNEPKKIIGDMMQTLLSKVKNGLTKEDFLSLAKSFIESLDEKHLMFYFKDQELEKRVSAYGWDGKIKNSSKDYLMIVNSNIAGAKSDKSIQEEIFHQSEVQDDGSIIDTVKIKRTHTAIRGAAFTGVRNVDWMRVYVPLGSKLISFKGAKSPDKHYFDEPDPGWNEDPDILINEGQALTHPESGTKIYEEKSKTVFANWCMVDPGETIEIVVKYKLPFKMEFKPVENSFKAQIEKYLNPNVKTLIPYSLLVQKQPGSLGSKFSSKLILPKNMQAVWIYPQNLELEYGGWNIKDILLTDKYYALAASLK